MIRSAFHRTAVVARKGIALMAVIAALTMLEGCSGVFTALKMYIYFLIGGAVILVAVCVLVLVYGIINSIVVSVRKSRFEKSLPNLSDLVVCEIDSIFLYCDPALQTVELRRYDIFSPHAVRVGEPLLLDPDSVIGHNCAIDRHNLKLLSVGSDCRYSLTSIAPTGGEDAGAMLAGLVAYRAGRFTIIEDHACNRVIWSRDDQCGFIAQYLPSDHAVISTIAMKNKDDDKSVLFFFNDGNNTVDYADASDYTLSFHNVPYSQMRVFVTKEKDLDVDTRDVHVGTDYEHSGVLESMARGYIRETRVDYKQSSTTVKYRGVKDIRLKVFAGKTSVIDTSIHSSLINDRSKSGAKELQKIMETVDDVVRPFCHRVEVQRL